MCSSKLLSSLDTAENKSVDKLTSSVAEDRTQNCLEGTVEESNFNILDDTN
jgi:hypothetical protein